MTPLAGLTQLCPQPQDGAPRPPSIGCTLRERRRSLLGLPHPRQRRPAALRRQRASAATAGGRARSLSCTVTSPTYCSHRSREIVCSFAARRRHGRPARRAAIRPRTAAVVRMQPLQPLRRAAPPRAAEGGGDPLRALGAVLRSRGSGAAAARAFLAIRPRHSFWTKTAAFSIGIAERKPTCSTVCPRAVRIAANAAAAPGGAAAAALASIIGGGTPSPRGRLLPGGARRRRGAGGPCSPRSARSAATAAAATARRRRAAASGRRAAHAATAVRRADDTPRLLLVRRPTAPEICGRTVHDELAVFARLRRAAGARAPRAADAAGAIMQEPSSTPPPVMSARALYPSARRAVSSSGSRCSATPPPPLAFASAIVASVRTRAASAAAALPSRASPPSPPSSPPHAPRATPPSTPPAAPPPAAGRYPRRWWRPPRPQIGRPWPARRERPSTARASRRRPPRRRRRRPRGSGRCARG